MEWTIHTCRHRHSMMTSSNGNFVRVAGPLWGEFAVHRSSVNFLHKGQWFGALMFSLSWAWTNGWANRRGAGDLRRAHYDVTELLSYVPLSHTKKLFYHCIIAGYDATMYLGYVSNLVLSGGTNPLPKPVFIQTNISACIYWNVFENFIVKIVITIHVALFIWILWQIYENREVWGSVFCM